MVSVKFLSPITATIKSKMEMENFLLNNIYFRMDSVTWTESSWSVESGSFSDGNTINFLFIQL